MKQIRHSIRSSNQNIISLWNKICDDYEIGEAEAIRILRRQGVKAAHPDDGWVDREENSVTLAYPQFNDGIEIGDYIALGWHTSEFRKVKITKIKNKILQTSYPTYYFE